MREQNDKAAEKLINRLNEKVKTARDLGGMGRGDSGISVG